MSQGMNKHCGCTNVSTGPVPIYTLSEPGIKLHLIYSVEKVECRDCLEFSFDIPNMEGLFAAAAIARAKNPIKLNGAEIKFIRKAMDISAKKLAQYLEVTVEHLSRWENDKAPITASYEKMLRLLVGTLLRNKAPAISFTAQEIADMKIRSVRPLGVLEICLTKVKIAETREPAYEEAEAKAA